MAAQIERSLQLTEAGIKAANKALDKLAITKSDLATRISVSRGKVKGASPKTTVGISRTTINKFFKGEPVQYQQFKEICKALELDWQEVSSRSKQAQAESSQDRQESNADIDALVQQVRQQIQPYIQEKCGTMRVLDMNQPIELGEIYTSVNILEKIAGRRGLELTELMQDVSPENYERFCLGDVREKRIPGLKAVEKFSKLMILGKPGAGKTTFLKHLAIHCIGGKFQPERLPIFVTLKDFAEAPSQPDLLEYLNRLIPMFSIETPHDVGARHPGSLGLNTKVDDAVGARHPGSFGLNTKVDNAVPLNRLIPMFSLETPHAVGARHPGSLGLSRKVDDAVGARHPGSFGLNTKVDDAVPPQEIIRHGRALILLDGLDEVRDADSPRVLRQIQEFSQQFPQNQFVITCRLAAREYTFEKFNDVEIADFNDEQIADFSGKWFRTKNDPIKADRFVEKLKEDAPIRELATNPLLLTLLCLVFEDSGSFPTNRAELYQTGVDVLLKKWDVKRNIERDQVYKRLSPKRKEDLLSQIACTTFEAGNYFFKQKEVERYITQYIQNLPDASIDPEVLELDSAAVLKSIEAQHGLFVERARGIYSFSHLTFHEYFTARKIVTSCNPYAVDDLMLQGLVSHLTEKRWREVFFVTLGMLDSADTLLRLMKAKIDGLLAEDKKLQIFLNWVNQKSASVEISKNSLKVFPPSWISNRYFQIKPFGKVAVIRSFYFNLIFNLSRPFSCTRDFALAMIHDRIYARKLARILAYPREDEVADLISREIYVDFILARILDLATNLALKNVPVINYAHSVISAFNLAGKLEQPLEQLKAQIIDIDYKYTNNWWNWNGGAWTEQLRQVMTEYRNIGHDWQFSDAQKERLQQYYNANKLLIDCLNSDCYVSREVRQEIEETLLLPIEEIKKYQQRKDDEKH